MSPEMPQQSMDVYVRRHLRFGWCALLIFATLGMVLEGLHGFKVGWYLNVSNETRRLLWTLTHAHGALLALVNMAFGISVALLPERRTRRRAAASRCLLAASVAIPLGFFLGGLLPYAGDPSLGILLVPIGGVLLGIAIALIIP